MAIITLSLNPSENNAVYDLLIIGAGIAGLAAGWAAKQDGYSVIILDKGCDVGGRLATRRIDGYIFNHGAQFITSKSPDFTKILQSATTAGAATRWQIDPNKKVYVGSPTMQSIPKFVAHGLSIYQNTTVKKITRESGGIVCEDTNGQRILAQKVVCTAPAPQSAELLVDEFPELAATAKSASYAPCWTVMLGLSNDSNIPSGPTIAPQNNIGWAVRETARPNCETYKPALTIQADSDWSRTHVNDEPEAVITQLIEKWKKATGCNLQNILYASAHSWLYAKVIIPANASAIIHQHNLVLAGDWLGGARVEYAFKSGIKAYKILHQTIFKKTAKPQHGHNI